MSKQAWRSIAALTMCVFLWGCPPPQRTLIYNNTNTNIIVYFRDRSVEWSSNTVLSLESQDKGSLEWRRSPTGIVFPYLHIQLGAQDLRYKLAYPDTEASVWREASVTTYYQLGPDALLYAATARNPATVLNAQPREFPVRPE